MGRAGCQPGAHSKVANMCCMFCLCSLFVLSFIFTKNYLIYYLFLSF